MPSARLLADYAFLPSSNPYDSVQIPLPWTSSGVPLAYVHRACCKHGAMHISHELSGRTHGSRTNVAVLFAGASTLPRALMAAAKAMRPKAQHSWVVEYLSAALARYGTTLEVITSERECVRVSERNRK
jgi:hypothetical protein